MSDSPVHIVANLMIEDEDEYMAYQKGFFPILKKHGGELITYDDAAKTFEGDNPVKGRFILARFPSAAAAQAWYDDPDYQAISQHRRAGTKLNFLTMLNSMPSR
ncbi:MAG: DUF1330 domain-containing protein [Kordiimonadaceae bacterium]|nr:DUF1330 domain-containing protein [Kordiimonadaceae bacterium]MBO6568895.1 DUF1330 domain-containing protein [Kordiimonadaceae bacterium]MBO6965130.1 DUF1330 domain-containing protein [Kordiimonadaceae bacterium]